MKIRYIGTSNYQEYPVTGTNALWQPEWVSDVSDSRATALVALGTFVYEDDSTYAKQLLDHAAEHAAMGAAMPVAIDQATGVVSFSSLNGVLPLGVSKVGNAALRYFYGRFGSLTNDATGYTYHHVEELPVVPDMIRIVLANNQTSGTANFQIVAALQANVADTTGNSLTYTWAEWTDGNTGNVSIAQVPNATDTAYQKYLVSDPIPLSAVDRDDGVAGAVLALRCFIRTTTAVATMIGNGTTDNWVDQGTRDPGKRRWVKRKVGQHISTPTTFTSPSDANQSPIAGVIYYSQGRVINIARFGDSTDAGIETLYGVGWCRSACEDLTGSGVIFEDAAFCRSGADSLTFSHIATDAMDTFGKYISAAFVKIGSPNSVTGTIDATELGNCKIGTGNMLVKCAEKGIVPIPVTWPPANPAAKDYNSSDSLRRDYNERYTSNGSMIVLDMDGILSGSMDGDGQVGIADGLTDDNLHPNAAGNQLIKEAAKKILRGALL